MLNKILNWKMLIYFFISAIIIFNFLDFNIEMTHSKLEFFFDSDMLYLHRLYMDVFIYDNHFLSWNLTPVPYFFPDMLVFFILEILSQHNVFFTIIGYAVAQYLLLTYLSTKISSVMLKSERAYPFIFSILILTLVFLVMPGQDCYRFAIEATYHFGEIISGLLLLFFLALAIKNNASKVNVVIISVIAFLSSASDPIFVFQFAAPAIFVMLFFRPHSFFSKHVLSLTVGVIFGLAFKYILKGGYHTNYMYFDPWHFYIRLKMIFFNESVTLLKRHPYLGSATLVFYFLTLLQCIFWYRETGRNLNMLRLFVLASSLMTFLCISLFETNGSIFQRYMLNHIQKSLLVFSFAQLFNCYMLSN